ncbi:MAG: HEAT repeat domain-containing protein [Verrucomicrobia bacterium]|nr:HEAT repeat domain-containing protein [Verrucomicrobiota bacterium]
MKDKLLEQLASADETARRHAAKDLSEHGDESVVSALIHALSDPARAVCEAAVESLIAIGGAEVCHQTISLLYSDDARVRNYAIEVLEKVGDSDLDAIIMLLKDSNHDVRKFASDILGFLIEIGGEDAFLPLAETLDDNNVNVAAAAAEALGRLGNPKAIPFLVRHLCRESWMQCNCIGAIAEIGGEQARQALASISPHELNEEARYCLEVGRAAVCTEDANGLA